LRERRAAGGDVLDLTESNPTAARIPYPEGGILSALQDHRIPKYDPHPAGLWEARAAVAAYYQQRGIHIEPGQVFLTASTSEAYSYLFKLLANPGNQILVPRPSYPLFEFLALLESLRLARYPLVYHRGWGIDFGVLSGSIHEGTRAVILVNPNNPTGNFIKPDQLAALIPLCTAHRVPIICDEVFASYRIRSDAAQVTSLAEVSAVLTFCLGGLSKEAGLPQMKLAWIVVAGPPQERARAVARLELIADTYLSVSAPVQYALPRLLEVGSQVQARILERIRGNLEFLRTAIKERPACELLETEGGWYAVLRIPQTHGEEEWCLRLLEAGVLVQPGYFYDFDSGAHFVLSLLPVPETFREGLRRMLIVID